MTLRVVVDARLRATAGGIQQAIIALVSGLSTLNDGPEEYLVLGYRGGDDWIKPYVHGPCRMLHTKALEPPRDRFRTWVQRNLPPVASAWRALAPRRRRAYSIPVSDGTIEATGADVMHFTFQGGFLTDVPSIYQPWDLQHLHLPQNFSRRERSGRDLIYRALCERASVVIVACNAVRDDLIEHYALAPSKISVVPVVPVLQAYPIASETDLAETRAKFSVDADFAFYPGHTWPHKNHVRLLEAIALVRDQTGISVPVVCSGETTRHLVAIERKRARLGLDAFRFVGHVSPVEMQCLYRLARCLIYPSEFEGGGLPVAEAFYAGVPVACSRIPPLEEQAGDAALLFDPQDVSGMATAIERVWCDRALGDRLVTRGRERVASLTPESIARTCRAHYRRLAGRELTGEDEALLAADTRI